MEPKENNLNCKFCKLLEELFNSTDKSGKNYYLITELFVLFHSSDICKKYDRLTLTSDNIGKLIDDFGNACLKAGKSNSGFCFYITSKRDIERMEEIKEALLRGITINNLSIIEKMKKDLIPIMINKQNIQKAINDIDKMRKTHIQWAEYFEKYPDIEKKYIATNDWDNAEIHRDLIQQYDNVLNILNNLKES